MVIKAVDNEGYTAEKTLTVTYNPVAEEARVRVIVSGEVLGLGTMIDETITAKSDQTVAQIVKIVWQHMVTVRFMTVWRMRTAISCAMS